MGGSIFRLIAGAVFGAVVAIVLFGGMRYLILSDAEPPEEKQANARIEITSTREISDVITRSDRPEQPDETRTPPPPPRIEAAKSELPDEDMSSYFGNMPQLDTGNIDSGGIEFAVADRDVQPLVRIPAQYPQRAQERELEGECTMTFDVDPEGNVYAPSIEADCTSSVFNREATRATERFRYAPKIQNGEPVWQRGIRTTFDFQLPD